jgi:tRNA(His) guanylyltransferase
MANTRFGYVRQYELSDVMLPGTFMVVRLDGKGFHRFSDKHGFEKPNDRRALDLMNAAALRTIQSETLRQHVLLAFGESDEYSFLLGPKSALFGRRNRCVCVLFC